MSKLVPCRNSEGVLYGYAHWCPGCGHAHVFHVVKASDSAPCWSFDGNMELPTFGPSMREYMPERKNADGSVRNPEKTLCHYFLKKGEIEFLGDSTEHQLRGKVPLPDFPPDYRIG